MVDPDELDEITQPAPIRAPRWFPASHRRLIVVGALLATAGATAGGVAAHMSATPTSNTSNTSNQCVQRKGGCTMGNSGRTEVAHRITTTKPYTPNDCIRINGGDYNACNVGNSGNGNLPYEPTH